MQKKKKSTASLKLAHKSSRARMRTGLLLKSKQFYDALSLTVFSWPLLSSPPLFFEAFHVALPSWQRSYITERPAFL